MCSSESVKSVTKYMSLIVLCRSFQKVVSSFKKAIDFAYAEVLRICIFQSFLRTCCLRQFGYFLSSLEGLQFKYNEEKRLFIGPAQPISTEETQEVAMEKMVNKQPVH